MALYSHGPIKLWPYKVIALYSHGPIKLWPYKVVYVQMCWRFRSHECIQTAHVRMPTRAHSRSSAHAATGSHKHTNTHNTHAQRRAAPYLCQPLTWDDPSPSSLCSTTVFSHAQTVVICSGCSTVLCQPTGGKARLTEGCSFRKKVE